MTKKRARASRHSYVSAPIAEASSPLPPARPAIDPRTSALLAAACSLAAFLLYCLTAAHDIVLGDTPELADVAVTLGVAHPPGYPLLTLLAHLFTLIAPGTLAFRANLLSVLAGSAGVGLVVLIACEVTRDRIAAVSAGLIFAVQPLAWEWSLVLEAFALNACLALGVGYALLRWDERSDRAAWLVTAATLTGLGVANHHTIVVMAVPALLLLWRHRESLLRHPGMVGVATAALVPGFALYGYLLWAAARTPGLNWGNLSSVGELVGHFLRATYGTFTLSSAVARPSPAPTLLAAFLTTFSVAEGLLVLAGLVLSGKRHQTALWVLAVPALLAGPVFALASGFDLSVPGYGWVLSRFFVLPHALLAPFMGVALAEGRERLARGTAQPAWLAPAAVAGVAFVIVAMMAMPLYARVDQRDNQLARAFGCDVLGSLPQRAVLVSNSDAVTLPVAYLQDVEGMRPDVTQVMLGPLSRGDWYLRELKSRPNALHIPFDHYDPANPATSFRALVDANPDRTFVLIGAPPDGSLEPDYWFLPHGLGMAIEPKDRDVTLAAVEAENTRLFDSYHLPTADVHWRSNFDPYVLRAYSTGARTVALQYLAAQRPEDAARWLRRAITIDPSDDESQALLGQAAR